MLEVVLIALGIFGIVAFAGGKIGHRLGSKWATREIANVFQREIVSKDNELKSVEERLRQGAVTDFSVIEIAHKLLDAAIGAGAECEANTRKPKLHLHILQILRFQIDLGIIQSDS